MTNQLPGAGRNARVQATMPRGDVVATFETYDEAQQGIDTLARADFPVRQLTIVGSDLKTIENVTGKLSYGRAAIGGAVSGAWLGLFLGLLLVIFSPAASSVVFIGAAILIGAGFGMLFRIVSYAVTRRRRDYTSTMQVIASRYEIVADPDVANRARNLLGQRDPWSPAPAPAEPPAEGPPPAS